MKKMIFTFISLIMSSFVMHAADRHSVIQYQLDFKPLVFEFLEQKSTAKLHDIQREFSVSIAFLIPKLQGTVVTNSLSENDLHEIEYFSAADVYSKFQEEQERIITRKLRIQGKKDDVEKAVNAIEALKNSLIHISIAYNSLTFNPHSLKNSIKKINADKSNLVLVEKSNNKITIVAINNEEAHALQTLDELTKDRSKESEKSVWIQNDDYVRLDEIAAEIAKVIEGYPNGIKILKNSFEIIASPDFIELVTKMPLSFDYSTDSYTLTFRQARGKLLVFIKNPPQNITGNDLKSHVFQQVKTIFKSCTSQEDFTLSNLVQWVVFSLPEHLANKLLSLEKLSIKTSKSDIHLSILPPI